MRFIWKNRTFLFIFILGVIIHLPIFLGSVQSDGATEMAIAESLYEKGEFKLGGEYDTHFPPVIPLALLPFLAVFGFNSLAVHLAQLFYFSLGLILSFKLGNLVNEKAGPYVALFYALDPVLFGSMMGATSEVVLSVLILLLTLSLIKGFSDPRFFVLGGFFAALTYLAKASSLFLAFLAVIIAGLFFYFNRKLLDLGSRLKMIILGGATFLATISIWSIRNYLRFGGVDTNTYTGGAFANLAVEPLLMIREIVIYLGVFALWLLLLGIPFICILYQRTTLTSLRSYIRSGPLPLILASMLLGGFVMAVTVGTALIVYEPSLYLNPFFSPQHIRYVGILHPLYYTLLFGLLVNVSAEKQYPPPVSGDKKEKKPHILLDDSKNHSSSLLPRLAIICVSILVVLNVPFIQAQTHFVQEYNAVRRELGEEGIEEVWTDVYHDMKYNLPDIKFHRFVHPWDIPDNATVISTKPMDQGSKEFWRYALTYRFHPPHRIKNISAHVSGMPPRRNILVNWQPVNGSDVAGYNLFWGPQLAYICTDFKHGMSFKDQEMDSYTIKEPGEGSLYYIAVVAVDGHGNFRYKDFSFIMIEL